MRLRKQLFFLSLITLALPWVGCQAVREMDKSLRLAQLSSLDATAAAVASRFAADETLRETLSAYSDTRDSVYAHAVTAPIYLDGYGEDDWLGGGIELQPLPTASQDDSFTSGFSLAVENDTLYAFVKVDTDRIQYFRPSDASLSQTDYLRVDTREEAFALFASAPGRISVERLSSGSEPRRRQVVHQIKGVWLESQTGLQLEFSIPLIWAQTGLQLSFIDANAPSDKDPRVALPELALLVTPSPSLGQELRVFAKPDTRLQIITQDQYRLATAGQIEQSAASRQTHGFLAWVYTQALGKPNFPSIESNFGRLNSETVANALQGRDSQAWYRQNGVNLAQASAGIVHEGRVLGAVVVEQSESSLTGLTDDAFGRLLGYSFVIALLAAVCLVGYATFLSLRIRRLNDAALSAISDSGKIADNFPVSQSADELGELSRSYDHLLSRLREYTLYLRSLSSKLSHELRTPLAIVRSSLDNLEHENIEAKAREYSARAKEGANRLSHILNAMSAASRVEQAIEQAEVEEICCYTLLEELSAAYDSIYQHHQFRFELHPDAAQELRHLTIVASPELLVQALDKLADNAADFSPYGKEIRIELGAEKHLVIVRVHNQGPLLPENMRGQLFDSLVSVRQADTVPTESSGADSAPLTEESTHHLGLGLYIVRLICDFHGGEARAYNAADLQGVIFELRLPRQFVGQALSRDSSQALDKQG